MNTIIKKENEQNIKELIEYLKQGKIVCFKTDTIYGMSCSAFDENACKKIVEIKHRDNKPMIVFPNSSLILSDIVEVPSYAQKIIKQFTPGPLTIIFKQKLVLNEFVTCGFKTIGIRRPKDKLCELILSQIDFPIVTTSVNIAGEPSINDAKLIKKQFDSQIDFILDSETINENVPSTIISVVDDEIKYIREGAITFNQIKNIIE